MKFYFFGEIFFTVPRPGYSLLVLKVPLNYNQPTILQVCFHTVILSYIIIKNY